MNPKIRYVLTHWTDIGPEDFLDRHLEIYEDGTVQARYLSSFGKDYRDSEDGTSKINPEEVETLAKKLFEAIEEMGVIPKTTFEYGGMNHLISIKDNRGKREVIWGSHYSETIPEMEKRLRKIYLEVGLKR